MAKLSSARRSFVKTLRDWPRGTRTRGWGFLHDQVWFPVSVKEANVYMHDPAFDVVEQIAEIQGEWHRLYLDRNMFWTPFGTIRLHTFYQGDDDAAPHDHPWWFITFPFKSYTETVMEPDPRSIDPAHKQNYIMNSRLVRAWRFHFRSKFHRHFVHEPLKPFRTLIITGRNLNNWSFFPDGKRVLHREWTNYNREAEDE